jgi:hypothetical protein
MLGFWSNLAQVLKSLAIMTVTSAAKTTELVEHSSNSLVNGVKAAEHISRAAEQRAKLYADSIISNGEIAVREQQLKSQLRLHVLEVEEAKARATPQSSTPAPTSGIKFTPVA